MNRFDRLLIGTCGVLVGGTLLLTSAMPAQAGQQGGGFREFRLQNAGLDRHSARRIFNADRKIDRVIEPRRLPVASVDIQGSSPADLVRADRQFARANNLEARINNLAGRNQSFQANDRGALVRLSSGVNLDLRSGNQNIVLGNNLFSDSVSSIQINVGGETKTLTAGTRVTAAEYVAAKQVLNGESQSLVIGRSGAAAGGNIDLGALTQDNDVMRASNLVVSSNVTTTGDFGRRSDFRLTGDLINYGTVNALSSDRNVRSGAIHADDITNHSGALINSTVDLTLDAAGNLTNDGTIVSSQGLTLVAGGALNNSGSIRATDSVNVQSSAINNSGLIRSTGGDVNLDGSATAALTVNNLNGTITALNGAINLRNTAYDGVSGSTITGGDLLSRELNMHSGQGLADVSVNELTGAINQTGNAAHVFASTDVLTIGEVCLNGDPTFYNNEGDINIVGNLSSPENLVIVAAGNIKSNNDVTIQAGNASKGFDITMIAGAAITSEDSNNSPTLPGGTAGGVTLSGKSSKTGGGIQLGSNTFVTARGDGAGSDPGGNIQLVAFGGKGAIAGKVLVDGTTFSTGGFNGATNGNLTIIAGSKAAGTVVEAGVFDTTGGTGGGVINITTAAPVAAFRNQPVVFDANGKLVSGLLLPSKVNRAGVVHFGNQSSGTELKSSGAVNLNAGSIIVDGQIEALSSNILLRSAGSIGGGSSATVKGLTVDLEAAGDIGSVASKFIVNTPNLTVNSDSTSKGVNTFLNLVGTVGSQTTVDAIFAKGQLVIEAPTLQVVVNAQNFNSYDLNTLRFGGAIGITRPISLFKLTTNDPAYNLNNFVLGDIKTVNFSIAGSFGQLGQVSGVGKVSDLTITAGGGIVAAAIDRKTASTLSATNDIAFVSNGVIKSANSSAGAVALLSTGGTLTIAGNVTAAGDLNILNNGAKTSDKIVFAANSQVAGDTIEVSVGPTSAVVTPVPIANVTVSGAVTLTGSGVKAKAPNNTVSATGVGHTISINNGFKNSNLSFAGGVLLTAN